MDAMTHLFQLRDPESFRGWLYKIARGKLAKWFKDRKRHATYPVLDDVSTDNRAEVDIGYVVPIAGHEQPENVVIAKERLDIVLNFINQLPNSEKDALLLKATGMQQKEIAKTLNISEGAVKVRLHRGLKTLEAKLESKYPGEFTDLFK